MTDEIIKHLQTMGDQIKFSKGFMSRSSHVLIALFSLGAIVIWKGDPLAYALWSVSFLGYFFWYFFTLDFAKKHPEQALLDGGEWLKYRQMEIAAKGITTIPNQPLITPKLPKTSKPVPRLPARDEE